MEVSSSVPAITARTRRRTGVVVLGYSFPLMAAFAYGQDVLILLLVFGANILLPSRGRDFVADLCLSLGAVYAC